jgi:hypothetical protein
MEESSGLYFSANDRVYDWAVSFLYSLRTHSPCLPVTFIPFDDESQRVLHLAGKFNFEVLGNTNFGQLEEIGCKLELGHTAYGHHWFRRFAAFWGPYQDFMYLDCRTLVLSDITEMIGAPRKHGFDLLHYDCALDQVYSVGHVRRQFLRDRRARGFNSGRWASRRGLFAIEELLMYGDECRLVREQLNPRNTDQCFLNYCCDRKGVRVGHFAEVLGDMCQDAWARQSGYVYRDVDGYRRWDHGGLQHRKRVPILHWAGIRLSDQMDEAELFYRFRDAELSSQRRVLRLVKRSLLRPILAFFQAVRRQRRVNMTYHALRQRFLPASSTSRAR